MSVLDRFREGRESLSIRHYRLAPTRNPLRDFDVKLVRLYKTEIGDVQITHRSCDRSDISGIFGLNKDDDKTQGLIREQEISKGFLLGLISHRGLLYLNTL
jgi:hypothetical protein